MLNSVSRRRSEVGRSPGHAGAARRRPFSVPAITRRPGPRHHPTSTRPKRSPQARRMPSSTLADRPAREPALRRVACLHHQRVVAAQVPEPQRRHARLPRAGQVAEAAQLEVLLRDHEPVGRLGHHLQPLARLIAERVLVRSGCTPTRARRVRPGPAAGAAAPGRSARRARSASPTRSGTSTPTSTTVVETSIWISPATNARITRSFPSAFIRPCSSATR